MEQVASATYAVKVKTEKCILPEGPRSRPLSSRCARRVRGQLRKLLILVVPSLQVPVESPAAFAKATTLFPLGCEVFAELLGLRDVGFRGW